MTDNDPTTPGLAVPDTTDPEEFAEEAGVDPTPQEVDQYLELAEERPALVGPGRELKEVPMASTLTRERLRECLNDLDFPADKDKLVQTAERKGDGEAVRALRAIPPADYANLTEVFGSVEFADDGTVPESEKYRAHGNSVPGLAESSTDTGPGNPIADELGENRGS
ncbi:MULTISPECIES: DUF2795 domain-containing protein [Amycolatopsis]|uniref:DUF2795 domain-containing protein n=2 Tax=Amycolatopsis TaxID=1813 RepID=A0A1I3VRK1_9PSEU|nr:DUF2795 domain-containing protein [Amycolatopsis sacchari]SFJ97790.1 Protein of unknown function [Amycolatopsis sacchari]